MSQRLPTLVFDGDCGICRYWVSYWRELTEERVDYRPYQAAAADFPQIPPDAFQRAIQLIEPDGRVYSGAAATFRVLRPPPRPAQRPHEIPLGPCAACGTLPAAELDLPAAVRCDLCGGVRVSRRAG